MTSWLLCRLFAAWSAAAARISCPLCAQRLIFGDFLAYMFTSGRCSSHIAGSGRIPGGVSIIRWKEFHSMPQENPEKKGICFFGAPLCRRKMQDFQAESFKCCAVSHVPRQATVHTQQRTYVFSKKLLPSACFQAWMTKAVFCAISCKTVTHVTSLCLARLLTFLIWVLAVVLMYHIYGCHESL